MNCHYGCGQKALYVLKNGNQCCSKTHNGCPVLRNKNSEGNKRNHKSNPNRSKHNRDHKMCGWNNGGYHNTGHRFRYSITEIFCLGSSFGNEYLNERIKHDNLLPYKCSMCGISEWNKQYLVLELHHINGNQLDNRLENLAYMCPNCHSQTKTFRGRNINTGRLKVSDKNLLLALKESKNIRQALIKVNLTPRGANYDRAKKLSAQIEISEVEQPKVGETLTGNADGNPERNLPEGGTCRDLTGCT